MLKFFIVLFLSFNFIHCQKNKAEGDQSVLVYPNDTTFLNSYIQEKPRLILTKGKLQALKSLATRDTLLNKYVAQCLNNAKNQLSNALPVYSSAGILTQSQDAFNVITTLSFAYLWTGEKQYAERVKQIMLTVSAFPDWNYNHFLDAAFMGTAVSLGFDWLYDYYDQNTRNIIIQALIKNCLEPGRKAFVENAAFGTWINAKTNWNFICNSSLIISSLAIAEWHREYADIIIPYALKSFPLAFNEYAPDGACFEGPLYEKFSLDFYSYCVASLTTSLNNTFSLTTFAGLIKAGDFYIATHGHSDYMLSFSDMMEKAKRPITSNLFFLGSTFNNATLINNEHAFLKAKGASVFHIIWYKPVSGNAPLIGNKSFGGNSKFVIFNDNKYGNNSIYMGIKAGVNGLPHSHLDLGNFEFDALGTRWARDLGMDDYNLTGYWVYGVGGQRWTYYRCGSLSHNVPIINGSNQYELASTSFSRSNLRVDLPFCIVDLSDAYKTFAKSVTRGIKLIDLNRSIIVQDEYSLLADQECYWGMTTDATIAIVDTKTAKLTLDGKELYAKLISPANGVFSVTSASQASPQNANVGVSRLIAKKPKDGVLNFTITVQLSPNWNGYSTTNSTMVPLSQWQ
jgi:hypothetical protein